jgi:hypothetical protein
MMRRFFTDRQKRELFITAGGECPDCGRDLTEGWHAHHRTFHSEGGPTDLENGEALCAHCHAGRHKNMNFDDAKFGQFRKDYSRQEESIEHFMSEIDTFYSVRPGQFARPYVNEVSPSGGKTIFSMKLARRLITDGLIDRIIWCVPRDSIKLGFRDDARQIEMPEAKRLIKSRFIHIDTDLTSTYKGALPNHHGMVITYQALPRLLGYFDLLRSRHRLLFIFDEAHHCSIGEDDDAMNIWGDAMERCRSFAHAIVCMTGTPLRSDAKRIPFVRYTPITASDGRSGYQVEPDYSFSYQKAVTAGIARKIVCRSQDTEITYEAEDSDGEIVEHRSPVSLIPAAHLNKVKNTAFSFDHGVVDAYLKIAHEECERLRKTGDDDAAILVIGRRDLKGESSLSDIAKRVQVLFGETAVTVESADGPDASGSDCAIQVRQRSLDRREGDDLRRHQSSAPARRCDPAGHRQPHLL